MVIEYVDDRNMDVPCRGCGGPTDPWERNVNAGYCIECRPPDEWGIESRKELGYAD